MVKPQQPELRRSDRGATSDDATKERLTAPSAPGVDGAAGGPIPEANRPGHHPDHEQDKPSGRDFVAKTHALAHEDEWEAPSPDDEVLDLTQVDTDHVHGPRSGPGYLETAVHLAGVPLSVAGKSFAMAGKVLGEVRKRLPG